MEELMNVTEENIEAPKRMNPFCVISLETFGDNAVHDIQTNSHWNENPYSEGYAVVPDEMVVGIKKTKGYCDIVLNEERTKVISFTAREIPKKAPKVTTQDDLLEMMIDHEFRITMMEVEMGVE